MSEIAISGYYGFSNAGDEAMLAAMIEVIGDLAPEAIIPCHCTGEAAVAALSAAFGNRCHPGHAGLRCQYDAG